MSKLRTLLLLPLVGIAACACDASIGTALHGSIVDSGGHAVIPNEVSVTFDGVVTPCSVYMNTYSCLEQSEGEYELQVVAGQQTWSRTIYIEDGGCHLEAQEVDVVFN